MARKNTIPPFPWKKDPVPIDRIPLLLATALALDKGRVRLTRGRRGKLWRVLEVMYRSGGVDGPVVQRDVDAAIAISRPAIQWRREHPEEAYSND